MVDKNGTKYYLHYYQVGSLRAVSDKDGNIIKTITYDIFSTIIDETNKDFKVPFGFAGGLYDPDTGLVRFGFRDYDPFTGRWTVKDPILFAGGDTNLYGYVLGDPVSGIDPSGLVDYNGISWDYHIKDTQYGFFTPVIALIQNSLLLLHSSLYNSECYTVMGHGYQGWSNINNKLNLIASQAKNSGKKCIELLICEIGQGEIPKKLHKMTNLPVKFTEDYVFLPPYGFGVPSLTKSPTAKVHKWLWIK